MKNTISRVKPLGMLFMLSWGLVSAYQNPQNPAGQKISASPSIRINEIFPRAQADVPEWFELINVSDTRVIVQNWKYGKDFDTAALTHDVAAIEPGRFLIVTKDKSAFVLKYPLVSNVVQPPVWRTLDNYKDTLQLWDAFGVLQDRVAYQSDWFEHWTNQSLERVSLQGDATLPQAWVTAEKPTPGQPNASMAFRSANSPSIEIGPIPFTPNGDGKDDALSVVLVLPAVYTAAISIYGFNGKKYCDLPITPQARYLWDGKMENGAAAPVGPFFVVAVFKNGSQSIVQRKKGILWR